MLAGHPEAWPLNETYLFSPYRGLGALLRTVPGEDREAAPEDREIAPAGLGRIFTRTELVGELRALAERWLALASPPQTRFVIEKSPWHVAHIEVIAEVLPSSRFVHVIRDGRDVAVSLVAARRSWSRFREQVSRRTVREGAKEWRRAMEEADDARDAVGDAMLELRYEEVSADPAAACRRMFDHCRMPYDEALVERVVDETAFERQEEPSGEGQPLRAGRIGDWRARFGIRDAWTFERVAGATLRDTGYEPDPRWWLRRPLRSRL